MGFNNLNNYNTIFYPCPFGVGWGTSQNFTVDCNRTQCAFFFFFALLSMKHSSTSSARKQQRRSVHLPLSHSQYHCQYLPSPIYYFKMYLPADKTQAKLLFLPRVLYLLPPVNSHPFG